MNMATKNDIFREFLQEYLQADKKKKGVILTHVSAVTKMHTKSVIRRFKVLQCKDTRLREKRGRPLYYTPDVTAALKEIWDISGELCGENLHPIVSEYVSILERDKQWKHTDEATGKLLSMSMGTMKERVGRFEKTLLSFGGKSTTKPSTLHAMIPVRMDGWDEAPVGTLQIDSVAHCGASAVGDFIYTVNATDTATLWGERRAQWNKGQQATKHSMENMEALFPTAVCEWHPDSGSEFINYYVLERFSGKLTRSRPYHKNDNCFVEERNGHVVRKWIGFSRFDVYEMVDVINAVYDVLTPFLNHFVPVRRIVTKERIGARWVVQREKVAKTPYQRMLERDDLSMSVKQKLRTEHKKLNPLVLRKAIDKRLTNVFTMKKQHGSK